MMSRLTIRTRLTLAYTAVALLLMVVLGVVLYVSLQLQLDEAADGELSNRANGIVQMLQQVEAQGHMLSLPKELQEHSDLSAKGDITQLTDDDGVVLFRSPSNESIPLQGKTGKHYRRMRLHKATYRVLQQEVKLSHHYTLVVASNRSEYQEALEDLRTLLLLGIPIALCLSFIAGRWMSGRVLRPIQVITETVRDIDDRRLAVRLPLRGSADELEDLSKTLNRMLDRLQQAFDRIGRFTADASHELRTPLALIRGNAEIMLRQDVLSSTVEARSLDIVAEADRMQLLIQSLLDLTRSDQGLQAKFELLDPADLTHRAAQIGRQLAAEKKIAFDVEEPRHIYPLYGNDMGLSRVLIILLENAFRHTPPNGEITLIVRSLVDACVFEVRDTGEGIDEAHLPRIFDRFYRVDDARNRSHGGAGLGLSIAKAIIDSHGGTIAVASVVGAGSTFTVHIPHRQMLD